MKTSLLKKLIAFLMATVLLVGMIGFTVGATDENAGEAGSGTETTPPTEEPAAPAVDQCDLADLVVTGKNVENKSILHLAFAVDYDTQGRIGIYVYAADAVVGVDAPIYKTYTQKQDTAGKLYFPSQEIEAEDIYTQYKIVPVVNYGGYLAYGAALTYSVADYCNERLADEGVTADQSCLYALLLELGKAAKDYLAPVVPEEEVTE